ncbi:MAG: spermidine synthase, partial [Fimbriiglobus sp.]
LIIRVIRAALVYGIPAAVAFALVANPLRFAACLAVLFAAGRLDPNVYGDTLHTSRNFFGTLRVTRSPDGKFTRLVHGTTLHGQQRTDEPGPPTPLMYYHRKGPVGHLFEKLPAERKRRVAVIGLGCGAMAAYGEPGQTWTFFEIDPAVVRIAENPEFFTFLRECRADWRIALGDARRQLDREPDGSFDLIALDAFSSDAIPVHLLTTEAVALYARKLAPNGVLAFHLSNRYLDLPPLVARLGAAQAPPFAARLANDGQPNTEDGKFPSIWVTLARSPDDWGRVGRDPYWQPLRPAPGPVWRDDFSNLLGVWKR